MSGVGFAYVVTSVVFVVTGQTLLKLGMMRVGPIGKSELSHPFTLVRAVLGHWQVWVGLALYATSAAMWIIALSLVPLSVAYPFLGLTYVGVATIAVLKLREWLTPAQWLGIGLVVAGVLVVTISAV